MIMLKKSGTEVKFLVNDSDFSINYDSDTLKFREIHPVSMLNDYVNDYFNRGFGLVSTSRRGKYA